MVPVEGMTTLFYQASLVRQYITEQPRQTMIKKGKNSRLRKMHDFKS